RHCVIDSTVGVYHHFDAMLFHDLFLISSGAIRSAVSHLPQRLAERLAVVNTPKDLKIYFFNDLYCG
ncbi:MAG: hypothetical protein WCL35_10960, partial [bacterium]